MNGEFDVGDPPYPEGIVVEDEKRNSGAPMFEVGGVALVHALGPFAAGDSLKRTSEEFGIPPEHLEEVLRSAVCVYLNYLEDWKSGGGESPSPD